MKLKYISTDDSIYKAKKYLWKIEQKRNSENKKWRKRITILENIFIIVLIFIFSFIIMQEYLHVR